MLKELIQNEYLKSPPPWVVVLLLTWSTALAEPVAHKRNSPVFRYPEHSSSSTSRWGHVPGSMNHTVHKEKSSPFQDFKHFGASIGLAFPSPLNGGMEYRINRNFTISANVGGLVLPIPATTINSNINLNTNSNISLADITNAKDSTPTSGASFTSSGTSLNKANANDSVSIFASDIRMRWHPWAGAFFFGIGAGYQQARVTHTDAAYVNNKQEEFRVFGSFNSFYIAPHLGWHWVLSSGVFLGTEIGVQIPFNKGFSVGGGASNQVVNALIQGTTAYVNEMDEVKNQGMFLTNSVIPKITLIRVGYQF